jgi:hypothetical protein
MAQSKSKRSAHFAGGRKIPSPLSPCYVGARKPDGPRGNRPAWRASVVDAAAALATDEADRVSTYRDRLTWLAVASDWRSLCHRLKQSQHCERSLLG